MIPTGFSLNQPAALWALLSLLVPLLIHLFNRSRGRLVHVGHIDLIKRAKKMRLTRVKPAQWLLLLLRLCIFALLALLLAGLSGTLPEQDRSASVYVTPSWLATSDRNDVLELLKSTEDTENTTVKVLEAGLPVMDQQYLEQQGPAITTRDIANVWPYLLEQLGDDANSAQVSVYTTDYALQFGSDKPALPVKVKWELSHPESKPLSAPEPYRAVIAFQPDRASDAQVMSAALEMLQKYRLPALSWTTVTTDQLNKANLDTNWLILLSDKELDATQLELMQDPTVVLSDAGPASVEARRELVDFATYPFTQFMLKRYTPPQSDQPDGHPDPQWRTLVATAVGQPVFQERQSAESRFLRFNSRFNAEWSSISQQAEFPELLLQLLLNQDAEELRYANARVGPEHLKNDQLTANVEMASSKTSLHRLLAVILALLWACERWLSERKSREIP